MVGHGSYTKLATCFWLDAKAMDREKKTEEEKEMKKKIKEVKQNGDEEEEKGMKEKVGTKRWKGQK
jgi:uncharacterized membrane protein (DUF106 family)